MRPARGIKSPRRVNRSINERTCKGGTVTVWNQTNSGGRARPRTALTFFMLLLGELPLADWCTVSARRAATTTTQKTAAMKPARANASPGNSTATYSNARDTYKASGLSRQGEPGDVVRGSARNCAFQRETCIQGTGRHIPSLAHPQRTKHLYRIQNNEEGDDLRGQEAEGAA